MDNITLGIALEWEEQPGDGTPCKKCGDLIFYKMHTMMVMSGPEKKCTNNILCDSCYNALDDE